MTDAHDIGSLRVTPGKQIPQANLPRTHAENLAQAWGVSGYSDSEAEREAYILWILGGADTGFRARVSDREPESGLRKALSELERRGINALARILKDYLEGIEPPDEVKAYLIKIEEIANADPSYRRFKRLRAKGLPWIKCVPIEEGLG
jgi:hypothetical protein